MPSKYSEAKWSPFHWRSAYKKEWMHVIKDWRRIHTTWYLVILVHIFEALSCNTHSYLRWNKVSGLHPHPFMNKPTNPASHEMHTSYRGYTGLLTGNYWDLTLTFLKMVPSLNAVVSCSADCLLMKYNFDNYFPNISRVLQLRWLSGEKQFIVYSTITSTVLTWQCEVVVVQLPYRFKPEFRRQELAEHFTFSSTQSRVVIQRSSEVSDAASFLDFEIEIWNWRLSFCRRSQSKRNIEWFFNNLQCSRHFINGRTQTVISCCLSTLPPKTRTTGVKQHNVNT